MVRRLLIAGVSLALAWLMVEWWFAAPASRVEVGTGGEEIRSIYDPPPARLHEWTLRRDKLRAGTAPTRQINAFSPRYGWWYLPGARAKHRQNRVAINAVGARGAREVGPAPPAGVLRVGCYGESFTFGSEVEDDEAWPARLEASADGALEVWNLGVGGWGTDQAWLRFRDTRDELRSDVVLVGFLSENIARNVNRLRTAYLGDSAFPLPKPRFVLEDGELVLLPVPYASELELYQAAVDGSLGIDLAPHEWWAPPDGSGWSNVVAAVRTARAQALRRDWWKLWKRPEDEPFRVSLALLEAFHAEALESGARFCGVVLFPTQRDMTDERRRLTLLASALEQRGIPYLDLYGRVGERMARGERTWGETHFTPGMNAEVADALWTWLRAELEL